jgi:undecaprenyl diphosphate synthase
VRRYSVTDSGLHIAIIPDGARRWANKTGLTLLESYRRTFKKIAEFVKALHDNQCAEISIYCLSRANLGRPTEQLTAVFTALETLAQTVKTLRCDGTCDVVSIVGDLDALPNTARTALQDIISTTPLPNAPQLNLLVCYDAWDEVRDAAKRKVGTLDLKDLWVSTRVDTIIRTGGGILMSGLLPLQSQYAQLIVTETLFNDLSDVDINTLVRRAVSVKHNFGR